jgi:hypothetical protein
VECALIAHKFTGGFEAAIAKRYPLGGSADAMIHQALSHSASEGRWQKRLARVIDWVSERPLAVMNADS